MILPLSVCRNTIHRPRYIPRVPSATLGHDFGRGVMYTFACTATPLSAVLPTASLLYTT